MKRSYVFLLGAPRSGTTWLQIMLSKHPDISTCQETHLFSGYLSGLQRSWRHHEGDRRGVGLQATITREDFIALQRQFALSVLDSIGDTPVILEKTPAHITVLEDLSEVLPEARFIHIIRDPRSVAASLAAAGKDWGRSWASTSALQNARRWVSNVSDGLKLRRGDAHRFIEVRYEDLLGDTAAKLTEIFAWMEVDPGGALSQQVAEETQIAKLRQAAPVNAWDLTTEPQGFFRKGKADGWKEDLTGSEIAVVEAIAGSLMEELSYLRVTPGMSWRQAVEIRTREGLARRLSSLAMRLQ
ncbi:MAG: sulfotransferase [Kiloniellaceae bacterium]